MENSPRLRPTDPAKVENGISQISMMKKPWLATYGRKHLTKAATTERTHANDRTTGRQNQRQVKVNRPTASQRLQRRFGCVLAQTSPIYAR